MATHHWYSCILAVLAQLQLLSDPIEDGFCFGEPAAPLNSGTIVVFSSSKENMAANVLLLVMVAGSMLLVSTGGQLDSEL
ncbi:hypothetical protein G9A89_003389 [Geosiphon pyriformis]|nr:hypothetical protein G9A89_003389 [Geosiphon pyriformis]